LLALNFCVPLDKGIVSNLSYQRIKVVRYIENEEYFQAVGSVLEDKTVESEDFQALKRTLLKKFEHIKINRKNSSEILSVLSQIPDPSQLADAVATHLKVDLKQSKKILSRVKNQVESDHRAYYLNEQIKAIQKELKSLKDIGDTDESRDEIADFEDLLKKTF